MYSADQCIFSIGMSDGCALRHIGGDGLIARCPIYPAATPLWQFAVRRPLETEGSWIVDRTARERAGVIWDVGVVAGLPRGRGRRLP